MCDIIQHPGAIFSRDAYCGRVLRSVRQGPSDLDHASRVRSGRGDKILARLEMNFHTFSHGDIPGNLVPGDRIAALRIAVQETIVMAEERDAAGDVARCGDETMKQP